MGKVKNDLTGMRFGELTVISRAENRISPCGKSIVYWNCVCSCGNKKAVASTSLISGSAASCGCGRYGARKTISSRSKKADEIIGLKFGRLTVIERAPTITLPCGSSPLKFRCLCECGNYVDVTSYQLRSGGTKSCGCLKIDAIKEMFTIDLTGKVFGRLTVVGKAQSKNQRVYWKCLCKCGSVVCVESSNLRYGRTRSCGCLRSNSEEQIGQILTSKNIDYKREYTFDELVSDKGGRLRFDFALMKDGMLASLIEFQGIQHFKEFPNRFGEQQRLVTDKMKYDFCKNKGIPLFYITYKDDVDEKCTQIIDTLYANTVPSSEESEKV